MQMQRNVAEQERPLRRQAALYEVETKRFNEQVKRNSARFPADFMFRLSKNEFDSLRSQFATLKAGPASTENTCPRLLQSMGRSWLPWC